MKSSIRRGWLVTGASTAIMSATLILSGCGNSQPVTDPAALKLAQKAVDIAAVQNLMGLYSNYAWSNQYGKLPDLFALKTDGVSYKVPMGPTGGEAIKAELLRRQAKHDAGEDPIGMLHVHPMSTPVIEIAGDGKTAKGVWDSFGPDVASIDEVGNWLYVKKAVDFIKEDGVWKIWHMQDYPVFNTPYDKSLTQSAKEGYNTQRRPPPSSGNGAAMGAGMSADGMTAVAPQGMEGAPPEGAAADGMGAPPAGGQMRKTWIYDGKTPPEGPKMPVPYETFDPADSY
ncbi:MAG: nuclear transport factor 2 family protein [Steroidobacteraceae bacterium]